LEPQNAKEEQVKAMLGDLPMPTAMLTADELAVIRRAYAH